MIIWILAIAIMSPSAIMLHIQEEKYYRVRLNSQNKTSPVYWCREDWPNREMRKIYTAVLFANIYLAPRPSLSSCMKGLELHSPRQQCPTQANRTRNSGTWWPRRSRRSLRCSWLWPCFSFSPGCLCGLMMLSHYVDLSLNELRVINTYIYPLAHWLAFGNSSINPIIYGFFNENFRRGVQDAFRLHLCQKREKPKEACTLRAKNNVVINISHLSAQVYN